MTGRLVQWLERALRQRSAAAAPSGGSYLMRLAGFGVRKPKQAGLGSDVAGVVAEVGAGVTGLRPGDAVFVGDAELDAEVHPDPR